MTNPLYDALIAPQSRHSGPLLLLADGREVSGSGFVTLVHGFAAGLTALGLKPGDRLAVQIEKSAEALALYGAALAAGIVFLPLNTAYTAEEIAYFVEDSGAALLIGDPAKAEALAPIAARFGAKFATLDGAGRGSFADLAAKQGADFTPVPRSRDDLAAILYTSGTTGRSKGAMLTQANLLENAEVLVREWRFTAEDRLLHMLPIFHTHGLFVASNVVLLSGGSMIFLPGFKVEQALAWLPQATTMMGVPTYYTRLLAEPRFDRDLTAHLRLFTSGSAPLLAETHRLFEERTGHRILERYGMTETNMSTSNPYDGERRAGTVGFPLPGVELRITDPETGAELPTGTPGMIEVRGHNVFKGYWQMPEKTREELRENGFFITGDIGVIDAEGYVSIIGRQKDLIISGGYNIYPKEIELLLDEAPGVLESAVIGVPHPDFGEAVVAVFVAAPGEAPDPQALAAGLAPRLARFKQPKRYEIVAALPRNTMGKVQKNLLRDTYRGLFAD
ncbi:malonate--CoA ligase [Paracoccus aminophilus]|uniref:Malonyl-CoA synthase n=1 Tax=Paracoccus aminophilus JCM 7686 TaxID=1367847 RepID=S5XUD4_PARAH|nr:malonyl-CoA synthase [Paracoccus aminophilus]AGT11089.1 malonyl-CoA synthase [Paracoccus aminophilus JCM 7686]